MGCDALVKKDGELVGWLCSRGKKDTPPCYICGRPSIRLCDFELDEGTCDRPMCRQHSFHMAKDIDYCEEHYRELASRQTTL